MGGGRDIGHQRGSNSRGDRGGQVNCNGGCLNRLISTLLKNERRGRASVCVYPYKRYPYRESRLYTNWPGLLGQQGPETACHE